jgi:phytol kinase
MKRERQRQFIHITGGIIFALLALHWDRNALLLLLGFGFLFGMLVSWLVKHKHLKSKGLQQWLAHVSRKDEKRLPGKGALLYGLGLFLALAVFPDVRIAAAGMLALSVGDGFSTLIGKQFGKVKLMQGKTFEGTLAGIIATLLALSFLFPLETAMLAAVFAMLSEYIPLNDNLVIPLVTGGVLTLLL